MRKNKLIALIGTLTMAATGLISLTKLNGKQAIMSNASSDQTYTLFGDHNGWNANDTTNQFKWNGSQSQYELLDVALSVNNCFRIVKPSDTNMQWAGWGQCKDTTNFISAGNDNNIKTKNAGRYNFYFKDWEDGNDNWNPIYVSKASYSVTLNKNGGTISSGTDLTGYTYGDTKTLPTLTKANSTFNGWYDNSGFTGNPVTGIAATDYGNKTFWAKFTENKPDPSTTLKTYYVYNNNFLTESNIKVYAFSNGSVKDLVWPGVGINDGTQFASITAHTNPHTYTVQLSESYTKLIINDGTNQTVDLLASTYENKIIKISGSGLTDVKAIDSTMLSYPDGYYVDNFTKSTFSALTGTSPNYSGSATLVENDQFKVTKLIGYEPDSAHWYDYTNLTGTAKSSNQLVLGTENNNIKAAVAGTYTVQFNSSTGTITINALPVASTISFDQNGGIGGQTTPIQVNTGATLPDVLTPTKLNNSFAGYYSSNNVKYYDENGHGVTSWDLSGNVTLYAHWSLDPGVYLSTSSNGYAQDGAIKMTRNGEEGATEFFVTGIIAAKDEQFRAYSDTGYLDFGSVSYSHPLAKTTQNGNNIQIANAGTYNIYYDTAASSHKYHIDRTDQGNLPGWGYGITINVADKTLPKADEVITFKEGTNPYTGEPQYYGTINLTQGDLIMGYYQGGDLYNPYKLYMEPTSVYKWEYDETDTDSLYVPESGNYSLYIIRNEQKTGYDVVSIFKEGEDDAIAFAKAFVTAIRGVCDMDGKTTNISSLQNAWKAQATTYATNQTGDDPVWKHAAATVGVLKNCDSTYASDDLKEFAELYDYVYGKYAESLGVVEDVDYGGNFAQRNVTPQSGAKNLISINNISSSTWIIATIAIVGIAAVGVFFIYKKRKEN